MASAAGTIAAAARLRKPTAGEGASSGSRLDGMRPLQSLVDRNAKLRLHLKATVYVGQQDAERIFSAKEI
jgi:hypothetical protein